MISINQKTAIYDFYVYFHINEKAIEQALVKPVSADEKSIPVKPKLSEFQEKLISKLRPVESIVLEDGADRGLEGKHYAHSFPIYRS